MTHFYQGQPTGVSNALARLYKKFEGKCFHCGKDTILTTARDRNAATRDHLIPKSKGGMDSQHNIVLSCLGCNHDKADELPDPILRRWLGAKYDAPAGRAPRMPAPSPERNRIPKPKVTAKETIAFLRGEAMGIPRIVPTEYSDPKQQEAFEAVYKDRLYMLRTPGGRRLRHAESAPDDATKTGG